MKFTSIKFKGYRCFQDDWTVFDDVKPITVIIGRNNVGKSHLLNLVEWCCDANIFKRDYQFVVIGVLDEESVRTQFIEGRTAGKLEYGNHWQSHGHCFVDARVLAIISSGLGHLEKKRFEIFSCQHSWHMPG